jgi:hypothetical protein
MVIKNNYLNHVFLLRGTKSSKAGERLFLTGFVEEKKMLNMWGSWISIMKAIYQGKGD